VAGLSGCERPDDSTAIDPQPPRNFMKGGAWFPEAIGYWFHQYAERDELVALMDEAGFTCAPASAPASGPGIEHLRCERSFTYVGGLLSRSDSARFSFRGNGTVEFAEAGCQYTLFDSPTLSGKCKRFVASGAVYPSAEIFAQVVYGMLRPASAHRSIDVNRFEPAPPAPLTDADDAVERLTRWRFDCEFPKQRYRMGFRGKIAQVDTLRCQQYSLRTLGNRPQSQQVLVYYDSVDLAVLAIEVRLDDSSAMLPQAISTRAADRASASQPRLLLQTRSGDRFEVLISDVGSGSRLATREGFESLTPASQLDLLKAYLYKMELQWGAAPARLSHLNAPALEWYGPQALPQLAGLLSDDRPVQGAALLKHLCADEAATSGAQQGNLPGTEPYAYSMKRCLDRYRGELPGSVSAMDRLLAQDLRDLEASSVQALNALLDFRKHVSYVIALGPDAREAGPALEALVNNKDGFSPDLQALIAEALRRPDGSTPAIPAAANRTRAPSRAQ
jgi:hypothetical protein